VRTKLPLLILAVASAVAGLAAYAHADDWNKDYKVSGTPEVRVEANDAEIRVSSADISEVKVHVATEHLQIAPGRVRISERQDGNRIEIEVHRPSEIHFFTINTGRSIRVEVTVPRQANLNLHTGDGNVRVDSVKGQMRADTGDGNIEGDGLDGALQARSGDGRIHVHGRFEQLQVHSGDGTIDVEAAAGSKIASSWSVSSGDGSVRLSVPADLAADLDAHTGDGHIRVNFPVTMSGSFNESTVRGKINGGGPYLEIRTGDGNITLDKM
jgi:DUF4097 and DUF4098 domain-containing protein YvlB